MRILLVNDYATPTAGAERITLDLRDGLRARGHDVRVFASRAQLIAGESFADATCYGTNSRVQTLTSTVNPSAARTLRRVLREFAPDVVQVHMFLWQLSPSILPLLRGVPSIYWAMTFKAVCPTGLKWLPSRRALRRARRHGVSRERLHHAHRLWTADAPARALAPPARRVRHDRELLARRASPARLPTGSSRTM